MIHTQTWFLWGSVTCTKTGVQQAGEQMTMVTGMEVMHGLSYMELLTHQGRPGYNLPAAETNTESLYGTIDQGYPPAIWWQVNYTEPLPSWKGQHMVLTEIDSYSGYGFAFPACNASAKTTICRLTLCLIHHWGIPHSIASEKRTHFTTHEVQQWVHTHKIHLSHHVPHHPEELPKDSVTVPARW